MAVTLLCGATGSGRSRFAHRLEADGSLRLRLDVETWRHGVRSLPAPTDLLTEIEDDLKARLVETIAAGRDVVVDFSFATRALREAFRELVGGLGVVAETVFLPVEESTALEVPTFAEYPLRVVDGDLTMRHASADDVQELLRFWGESAENASRPQDSEAAVDGLLARDPASVIVAELEDHVVGTLIAGWDGWRAHLYRLAVSPEARGRGIARRLLGHGEQRLRALGATRLDAMVLDENEAGAAVWRAAGYEPQGEWSRWVKAVDPRLTPAGATVG